VSPDGIGHYPVVVEKLAAAHLEGPTLTADDLAGVTCRALVMMADDEEVTVEHAAEFYRALPRGELAIVPGTSHGLLVEKPDLCHHIILDFLTNDPVPTPPPSGGARPDRRTPPATQGRRHRPDVASGPMSGRLAGGLEHWVPGCAHCASTSAPGCPTTWSPGWS
jgi:hypothetical protein